MNKFDEFRLICKKNKLTNYMYNILKKIYYCVYVAMSRNKIKFIQKQLANIHIKNIMATIEELLHSNKSLGRFGDGEVSWLLDKSSGLDSFEKPSKSLSINLDRVLKSNNANFMIGLPDSFVSLKNFRRKSRNYFIRFLVKNFQNIYPYLTKNEVYYDANVTRPYIDYKNKENSGLVFYLIKKLWKNKNVLIIEGSESRLGVKDDLLRGAKDIKRIECPTTNAFESYNKILRNSINFLNNHNNYISLISLGPTATVLSYDICEHGFRAIDIGNIDIEYNWYKLGVTHKIDLPYHYVNELLKGQKVLPLNHNDIYYKEIVKTIK